MTIKAQIDGFPIVIKVSIWHPLSWAYFLLIALAKSGSIFTLSKCFWVKKYPVTFTHVSRSKARAKADLHVFAKSLSKPCVLSLRPNLGHSVSALTVEGIYIYILSRICIYKYFIWKYSSGSNLVQVWWFFVRVMPLESRKKKINLLCKQM